MSADMIMDALPRSRFLFLLRDGRDVVDSELAANRKGSWVTKDFPGARGVDEADRLEFVAQSAWKWLWRTEVVQRAFASHSGPKTVLRYEDLRADPLTHVRSLFSWLGLSASDLELRRIIELYEFERLSEGERGERASFVRLRRDCGGRA